MINALLTLVLWASPPLIVEQATKAPPANDSATAWLWLNALGDARRTVVAERLEGLATRLEARFHPLIHDFIDEPLEDDVRRFLHTHLPRLNTARALSRGAWPSPTGGSLRLTRVCPSGAQCTPLKGLDAHRAFRAWPVAHAVIVQTSPDLVADLAAKLRAQLPHNTYGLIVTSANLKPHPAPRVAATALRLHKRLKRLEPKYAQYLKGLLDAAKPQPVALAIADDEVWVVPRLSGLGQTKALRALVAAISRL